MLPNIFKRSGSSGENSNPSENIETPPENSEILCSSPSSKKRNHSSTTSDKENSKRPHLNDSFILQLENVPSDHDTSALSNITNADNNPLYSLTIDQLEVPFDKNTPYWVPILLKSFDTLKKDIHSSVFALSDEVKSINSKFDNFCNGVSSRLITLENRSTSLEAKNTDLEQKLNCAGENADALKDTIVKVGKKCDTVKNHLKTELDSIKAKNLDIEKSVQFSSDAFDEMQSKINLLTSSNENLLKTIEILTSQIDANEQHNRNECLLLHGVPEGEKETPMQSRELFAKTINTHLINTDMIGTHIKRAHRLGKRKQNGKPRPIIARLWDSDLRNHIYHNKKEFKNTAISITENLTRRRMLLKNEAEAKYGPKNVWSKEGRIYAKENDSIIPIIL